jgi:SAM-dependent methyltransferase
MINLSTMAARHPMHSKAGQAIDQKMRDHYETVWQGGDAWSFENSEFEQSRYNHQLAMLSGKRYGAALEIGCGSGCFTRRLGLISDRVVALDISAAAIERARAQVEKLPPGAIELRVANIMDVDLDAEGPWDLIVFSETIYCLGWLYPMFEVAFLVSRIFESLRSGGQLLLANTYGAEKDWLLRPWLINTYRDLCCNVGFRLEREDLFRGNKEGIEMTVLMSLFAKGETADA